jgi:hypothetical protein
MWPAMPSPLDCSVGDPTYPLPFSTLVAPARDVRQSAGGPTLERKPRSIQDGAAMNTKITIELTPEQIRFLRYVAELEGLTVEQYLLRFAKGQIVHQLNSQKS